MSGHVSLLARLFIHYTQTTNLLTLFRQKEGYRGEGLGVIEPNRWCNQSELLFVLLSASRIRLVIMGIVFSKFFVFTKLNINEFNEFKLFYWEKNAFFLSMLIIILSKSILLEITKNI